MATIGEMKKRFDALDVDQVIYKAMKDSEQDINDLNREQLYSGKTNTGADIRPSYLEDPYWDDKGGLKAAIGYSNWKDRITPNQYRNPGTPNLFINGYFYSHRIVTVVPGGKILHGSTVSLGKKIEQKYANIDGLGGKFKETFLKDYLIYPLSKYVEEATGLVMKK